MKNGEILTGNSRDAEYRDLVELCDKKTQGLMTATEVTALIETNQREFTGKDFGQFKKLIDSSIDRLVDRADDFFVHPVEFTQLQTAKEFHQRWVQNKVSEGKALPEGITAYCNPFMTQYLTDVCHLGVCDATNELIDLFIVNPRTHELPELLESTCSPDNRQKASDLISNWWRALSQDGLDSSQIIRTLCGERRKTPEGMILSGDLLYRLFDLETDASDDLTRLAQELKGKTVKDQQELHKILKKTVQLETVRDIASILIKDYIDE